jgi:hypothetical protein
MAGSTMGEAAPALVAVKKDLKVHMPKLFKGDRTYLKAFLT